MQTDKVAIQKGATRVYVAVSFKPVGKTSIGFTDVVSVGRLSVPMHKLYVRVMFI